LPLRFSIRAPGGDFSLAGPAPTQDVEVAFAGAELGFGRALGADIQLPFPKVSARHARLLREAGGYRVEDLGSSNGTRLGGRRLAPHAPESIAIGEVLDIGGVEVRFEGEKADTDAIAAGAGTETLARRLVHDIFEACPPAECARLVVLSGPQQGRELLLSASGRVFKLGRGEGCDLVLPDEDVSREHALFERGAGGIVVRDLGSKNGVEVAGEKVAGERCLRDGEIVRVGETRLRLVDPEDRYLRQMEAAVRDQPPGGASPEGVAEAGKGGAEVAGAPAQPAVLSGKADPPSRLPVIATAVAVTVLVLALGVVLALAFGA
jgi:pSer/pThr/pTyr-binding forkhead associated (FHA) protein